MAGRLFYLLARRFGKANVFIDVVAIEPGRDFGEAIERAVGRCDVLLALIGREWLSGTDERGQHRIDAPTDLVRLEIKSALDRDIQVIPVLVDGAMAPRLDDLPEDLAPVARLNAVRLDHETFDADMGPLMKVLDRAVRPPWLEWLRRLTAAAAVAVVVVLWVLWFLSPSTPETRHTNAVVTKTTDPCSFVSTDDLAEFGRALLTPEYGYFAGCTATIQAGGETPVDVRIELDVPQYSGRTFAGTVETRGELVNIPGIGFTSRTDEPRVEVVQLLVHGADSRTVEQMCSYARALAEVVVPRT